MEKNNTRTDISEYSARLATRKETASIKQKYRKMKEEKTGEKITYHIIKIRE